ncbi:MAG TPA: tetratricopeptide repeat protein [Bryobacteraceae bacterium]|nr:tetratricopeptide repeat protein [Bryobacteraceae bacterium]
MPFRFLIFAAVFLVCERPGRAQQQQIDASPGVFSVMAAWTAATANVNTATASPVRAAVIQHVAAENVSVLAKLKRFVRDHPRLGSYVAFALATEGPPDFRSRFRQNEIPPDVAELEGFEPLMIEFHQQANIDALWEKVQPRFEQEIARYQPAIIGAVMEAHGYVRQETSGYMGRRFQIYIDLVGPANQVHTRSYKEDYYLVITPAAAPQASEVRHAYLHYLLDPMAGKYSESVNRKKPLIDIAQGAPLLEPAYKEDFLLLATESLIRAIEARLARPQLRQALVSDALAEGYILAPYFFEALASYEKQQQAMRLYYPDLIAGIDLKKESRRLENVQFASRRRDKPAPAPAPAAAAPPVSAAEKTFEEAEGLYASKDFERARAAYLRVLESGDARLHSRAYYGLARIAALSRNPQLAEELFRKTLELSPDAHTQAWSEVYLGRLALAARQPEEAAGHFRRALAVEGASQAAKLAAEQGLNNTAK